MFWKKKKVTLEDVKTFQDAIRAIKSFIYISEWNKASAAIEDLEKKEKEAFIELEHHLKNDYKELQKQRKRYEKNRSIIIQLKKTFEVKKIKYQRRINDQKFKVHFSSIKKEIKKLSDTGKNNEALTALSSFFEENKNTPQVVVYYAHEKKRIAKNIKKRQVREKKKEIQNTELEAIRLAWITLKSEEGNWEKQYQSAKKWFLWNFRIYLDFHKKLKEKYRDKKLLDEIKILIEENSKAKQDIAKKKLSNMHKGLVKELEQSHLLGFDMYGKILGSDKISGDCFGIYESKKKYTFYMWDATGHGVQAGLIVSILSKTFNEQVGKDDIINLSYEINNTLKESLQSKHFITGMLFEIDKKYKNIVNISWMWHEPLIVYRKETNTVEKIIVGGLAAGIRKINQIEDIKPKAIEISHNDIFLIYSDGIVEAKNKDGDAYGIKKLQETLKKHANATQDMKELYNLLMQDIEKHRWGTQFDDDATILLFSRNTNKDLLSEGSKELDKVAQKEWLNMKEIKQLEGKSKQELKSEVERLKKERQLSGIIASLKGHYYTGEFLKLKEEAIRHIKDGFVHEKINFYLKKAIENEDKYRISQKNTKMSNKYSVLLELYKKKDFATVVEECNEIIAKDWNI